MGLEIAVFVISVCIGISVGLAFVSMVKGAVRNWKAGEVYLFAAYTVVVLALASLIVIIGLRDQQPFALLLGLCIGSFVAKKLGFNEPPGAPRK